MGYLATRFVFSCVCVQIHGTSILCINYVEESYFIVHLKNSRIYKWLTIFIQLGSNFMKLYSAQITSTSTKA